MDSFDTRKKTKEPASLSEQGGGGRAPALPKPPAGGEGPHEGAELPSPGPPADGFAIAAREGALLPELEPEGAGDPRALALPQEALAPPADPLDEFFYRVGEPGSPVLDMGIAVAERREAGPVAGSPREYLTFLLGSEEYGLEIGQVREILKAPPITEVPRVAACILGVITVRGEVIAVFDPRKRLGLPAASAGSPRVVVCDAGEGRCGLLVDAVSGVVRLAPSAIEARPQGIGGVNAACISGIGRDGDRLFILLEAGLLLRRPQAAEEAKA